VAAEPTALDAARPSTCAAGRWVWTTSMVTACGLAAGAVLAPDRAEAPPLALTGLLFLAAPVHVASTGWLFSIREVRAHARSRPERYLLAPACVVLVAAALAVALPDRWLDIVLLGFFAWQFFHFQKQNLGLVALAAGGVGAARLSRNERRALLATGWAGIAGLVAHPGLLQLQVGWDLKPIFLLAGLALILSALAGIVLAATRRRQACPAAFACLYLLALLFPLPIFLFTSPYAAVGGLTIAHGLQYLLLVGTVTTGPVTTGTEHQAQSRRRLMLLTSAALLCGVALTGASHLHYSTYPAFRVVFGVYVGLVMAHFIVDAAIWRMRDPFPRALLARRVPWLVRPAPSLFEPSSVSR
jgi:hypothetical protein